jgi:predicted O-methyltransferase YrrM
MDAEKYLKSYMQYDHPILEEMAASNAVRDDLQPSIEPELARFLCLLVRLSGSKKVLELGTSNGYSSIWLAETLRQTGGLLWSVDNHERTNREAADNMMKAGADDIVTLVRGDVGVVLKSMLEEGHEGGFDLVFQDCGKSTYPEVYEYTVKLVKTGGIIFADDTLFSLQKNVRKNLGTFTDRYNEMVFADNRLYSVILPIGHGITLSYKKPV